MTTGRTISEKKIAANRRNARQSTGPKTQAGKQVSRLNALTHGLLSTAVVITVGDYQEDAQAFAQLLEALREQFTPDGVAEDLEVQDIALYYWRKLRAIRFEHGAVRRRTVDLRESETLRLRTLFGGGAPVEADRERRSNEIASLISSLEETKEEVLHGALSEESRDWLSSCFPDEFPPLDETQGAAQTGVNPDASPDDARQMVAAIDAQLRRLISEQARVVAIKELNLQSMILVAALPADAAVDKLIRYETSNDRALDRALRRLEGMQARRRKQGDASTAK